MTTLTKVPAGLRLRGPMAFSLVELLVAMAVSVIVVGAIATLSIISAQNFVATSNYVQLNDQSRLAVDLISREVRNATALISFSTNNPKFLLLTNANANTVTMVSNNPTTGVIVLAKTGVADRTLLSGCDEFGFQLFNRYPYTNGSSFYGSTNVSGQIDPKFCKVINMQWKCSRSILGSKLNTVVVQTAQVVMRNQVNK